MGIETLNKAALAAGFVMAAPDDDPPSYELDKGTSDETRAEPGRWLVPAGMSAQGRQSPRDALMAAAAWIKGHVSLAGWRAPA